MGDAAAEGVGAVSGCCMFLALCGKGGGMGGGSEADGWGLGTRKCGGSGRGWWRRRRRSRRG